MISDHVSNILFCPTETAVENLAKEGITDGVHCVGDVMYDALLSHLEVARRQSKIMANLGLSKRGYALTDPPGGECGRSHADALHPRRVGRAFGARGVPRSSQNAADDQRA